MNMWTVILAGLLIVTLGSALEDDRAYVSETYSQGVLASGATRGLPTDDKVAIVLNSTKLLLGKCPNGPTSTMNVRLQAMKTKSGAIFRRKVLSDDAFACLAAPGSKTLAASSILECSMKAEVAGLKMFRWDGGLCTGYTNGIPVNIARCPGAGSVVLYSLDVPAIKSPVVSNLTLVISEVDSTIDASWDVTPTSCFGAYRVNFNNIDTFVSPKLATVGFGTAPPCAEFNLTVTPVDANRAVMGTAATVKVVMPKVRELSLILTHGVTAIRASGGGVGYTCNPNRPPPVNEGLIKSYVVIHTAGGDPKTTNSKTFEFTFNKNPTRCSDTASSLTAEYNQVTLKAFDGVGGTGTEVASITATLTNTIMPGHRYDDSGNCLYYQTLAETPSGEGYTYDELLNFCQNTMLSEPYSSGTDGLPQYIAVLTSLESRTPSIVVAPHYLGVKKFINIGTGGTWVWRNDAVLLKTDAAWDAGEPGVAKNYVELRANKKLAANNGNTRLAAVCYDPTT